MKNLILFSVLLLLAPKNLSGADVLITNLKVEYAETPLGIDVDNPRFSWQMASLENKRGRKQTAYRVVVTDEDGQMVWDSGKISSDQSLNQKYNGKPLAASTRYQWTVSVWDNDHDVHMAKSWFETGLMNPAGDLTAWNGAKWIGGTDEDMVLYAHYLPVFKISYSLQLDEKSKSTKAGFIYGGNDYRLMDPYKNLYQLENKRDESYIKIELDIAPLLSNEKATLKIYRVGYHPDDNKEQPLKSFLIPKTIINNQNKYEKHTVFLNSELGWTHIFLNGSDGENRLAEINLNPLGQGGDFIAFPVVGDIGFYVPQGQRAIFSSVEIRNFRSPSNLLFEEKLEGEIYSGIFSGHSNLYVKENAYVMSGRETDELILANSSRNSMPMLRTTFSAQPKIAKARLYVTARGIYEIFLNGKRISEDWFNPGLTQYNQTHLYQTYDVTEMIQPGDNALGAILGEGWWSGGATYIGGYWNFFGDRQSLLSKLVITYTDGKEDIIVSDPSSWFYFNDGPVVYGSFFQGEVYNALKESQVDGWSTPSYDASAWTPASEIILAGHVNPEVFQNRLDGEIVHEVPVAGQYGKSVRKIRELTAISFEEARPGVYVYDLGQNMVGVPHISLSDIEPGSKIVLRFAEVLYPDLPQYNNHVGMLMLENIRAAMAQEIYIAKGGEETITPRFTFHGFRFVEITGIERPLPLESVKGTVISSVHELASHYETSNPQVNKLWENITWSTFGNFLSIPTDCPQRNERLGWSGDISVFARTATYLADVPQFLRRHLLAMRDLQEKNGRFPDVAPVGVGFGGLLWGSAGITVAWESYQQYYDLDMLAEHYDAMKSYINYVQEKTIDPETNLIVQNRAWSDLGDWLAPEQGKNDQSLLWEAYFIYDLDLMTKMALVLGEDQDADEFRQMFLKRKKFFNETYINQQSGKTVHSGFMKNSKPGDLVDTQSSYVLPLAFNIINDEQKENAVGNLVATVTRKNMSDNGASCPPYSLMTGFIGTSWISEALSETGNSDAAYRLLQQTDYPSWLYPVAQGATTIWERLDSYTHVDGFGGNNRMNSFNHYSFGAVAAWMYNYSLGIKRDESSPGFKHFILQPQPDPTGEMTYAKGFYDSMYGRIESSWERKGDAIHYRFVVPANSSATVYIPLGQEGSVEEIKGSNPSDQKFEILKTENGKVKCDIGSGLYHFISK